MHSIALVSCCRAHAAPTSISLCYCIQQSAGSGNINSHLSDIALQAEPQDVQASFATLLDDEDEYEYEFEEGEEDVVEAEVDTTLLVENQGLSQEVIYALKKRGINALFPIQRMVLQPALEGVDLIGRAKTGSGKTLAFALPVVESLLAEDLQAGGRKARGRTPR